MPKTKTSFAHPITKPPASTLEFKNFYSYFAKYFCDPQTKTRKTCPPQLVPPVACGNAYVKHLAKFSDFFETHNVGNPG